jgi:hypothetical protein
MPDGNLQTPGDTPRPLDYRQPEPLKPGTAIVGVTLGLFVGVAVVCGIGVFAFFPSHPDFLNSAPHPQTTMSRVFGVAFVAIAIGAFVFEVRVWRVRPHSRWFLMGFLLGGGLTCLLEGACFAGS